jgi:DNA-binding CsgD family transcriptional regulator/tetratricopeptide (TPR) repeat protein
MDDVVGRREELRLIDGLIGRLPATGGSLVMHGEAGIGKTTLGRAALARATARGMAVASVTATESEAGVPYAALQEVLHPYAARLRLMRERPRTVLERAFGLVEGESPDMFAVAMATFEFLIDIAAERGLFVLIDDAQWVDGSTARVLSFLGRRVAGDPLVLIMALRDGHPSPILRADLDTITVEPLPETESWQLLTERRPDLTDSAARNVLRLAGGNPLALLELPADVREETSAATVSDKVHRAFLARLAGAAAPTRTVLLLAALDDGDSLRELEDAARLLGISQQEFDEALAGAAGDRALAIYDGRFVFPHPLVRSAIVSAASARRRRSAHAALAGVIGPRSDRGVWHKAASASGPDAPAAAELEAMALRATTQGNFSIAFRAWELAATLSPEPADQARCRLRSAEAAVELGRPDVAATVIGSTRPQTLGAVDAARFALLEVSILPRAQAPADLRFLVQHGRNAVEAGDLDLAVDVSLTVAENLDAGGFGAASELAELVAGRLDPGDPRRLAVLAGPDPASYLQRITETVTAIDPAELTKGAELLIRVRANIDADPALAQMQRRLLALYRSRGQLRSIAFMQPVHAWNEITLANWPEALRSAEEGSRLAVEIGFPRWGTGTLIAEAFVAAIRGDQAQAAPLIEESERGALQAGANNVLTGIQLTKGVNHVAQGRYDEAFLAFRRAFDPNDPSHHPVQSGWMLGDLAEAAAHTGRIEEVRGLYARDPRTPTSPWQKMAEVYAGPFLAADDDTTEGAFQAALSGVVAAWPTYRTRMILEYGSWLRRRYRIADAREQLTIGREWADAFAMRPWSDRARAELRATGAQSAARQPAAWESLSAQELQVAELAAQGLSNREIGERLFLSHRTVGSHLYRLFPKIGVTSRAQLAAVLKSGDRA